MRCNNCDALVTSANRFCPGCGSKLELSDIKSPYVVIKTARQDRSWHIIFAIIAALSVIYIGKAVIDIYKVNSKLREGDHYIKSGKYEKSLKIFEYIVRKTPKNVYARAMLARSQYELGMLSEAEKTLSETVQWNSDLPEIYEIQGLINIKVGKEKEAAEFFERAVKLNSKSISVYLNLSNIYSEKRKNKKAIQILNKGLALTNDYKKDKLYLQLGKLLYAEKDFVSAIKSLNQSLAIEPNNIESFIELAKIYIAQDKIDLAESQVERALKINKNSPGARNLLYKIEKLRTMKAIIKFLEAREKLDIKYKTINEELKSIVSDLKIDPEGVIKKYTTDNKAEKLCEDAKTLEDEYRKLAFPEEFFSSRTAFAATSLVLSMATCDFEQFVISKDAKILGKLSIDLKNLITQNDGLQNILAQEMEVREKLKD